jgi:hypothetical protein
VNNVTIYKIYITLVQIVRITFGAIKNYYYATINCFTDLNRCRYSIMACQYIHPHGWKNQDYPECRGRNYCCCLASKDIRSFPLSDGYTYLKYVEWS